MSFGKMNTKIDIIDTVSVKDNEGFSFKGEEVIASVRAYKDEQHGSRKWANMAAYTKANATFQLRKVPGISIEPGMLIKCDTVEYKIIFVEIVRGIYIEIAAEKIEVAKN